LAPFRPDVDGNLICRAADAAGLDFEDRHDIFHRGFKSLQRILAGFLFDDVKRIINDLLRYAFFTVIHNAVDQARNKFGIVKRIGQNIPFCRLASSWHFASLLHNHDIFGTRVTKFPWRQRQRIYQPLSH